MPIDQPDNVLAVDYGTKRVGLAICSLVAKLPQPYKTLDNNDSLFSELINIIKQENIKYIVVGLPRNLSGNSTEQTELSKKFIDKLGQTVDVPLYAKDEALTSVMAEEELQKNKPGYNKSDVDALAASYILQDWLKEDYKNIS